MSKSRAGSFDFSDLFENQEEEKEEKSDDDSKSEASEEEDTNWRDVPSNHELNKKEPNSITTNAKAQITTQSTKPKSQSH